MIINGTFRISEELGRGSFATVYKATIIAKYPPLNIGDVVAIKSISTNKFSTPQEREKLENEISLMRTMDHENIVKLYGVERTRSTYFLIMEYCETGDLHYYLKKFPNGLSEDVIYNFTSQITKGMKYLISKEIIHRDLKPQNIMIRGTWPNITLKIADFGFARFLHQNDLAETICGSPIYMAPEIQFNAPYSQAVDMWSLGVILYEMATTEPPFPNCKTTYELTVAIKKQGAKPIKIPSYIKVSDEYKDIVTKLLTINPAERMTLQELLDHPYFREVPKSTVQEETSTRKKSFSFANIITIRRGETPDKVLSLVKDVCDTIEQLFTDCQDVGDAVLFDLLTTMCEFVYDMLMECKSQGSCEMEDDIIEILQEYRNEACDLEHTNMDEPTTTSLKFLFDKGMEFTKAGIKAEQEGDMSYAQFKYKKAMLILCPLVFLIGRDKEVAPVRSLYDQLMARLNVPAVEDSITF